uniref:ATP synthase F0 subunit 8 n=1 Tax=Polyrhachis dives TaxID=84555 RepID=A0A1B0UTX1_9HYME|nr:ATP synthase F0 subunit 8 [Polyrhachis dives]AMJ17068.1 ATP synthase F0 subunit 8 [Polyrhachis dives]AUT77303.1 ATP synthase F0 subunit 8 [Polyrhachis dives]
MPHMMPMMWVITYLFTLFFILFTISLLYFFYIPSKLSLLKSKKSSKFYKWNWLW